jgi:hypothetical protein
MFYQPVVLYYDRKRLSISSAEAGSGLTFVLFTYRMAERCDLLLTLAKGHSKFAAESANTFARVPEHRRKT